jgi:hypothetical protein
MAYEVWTGPSPLLTQRDFLVRQSNVRFSIWAIRRPSNRGNVLQQHFSIGHLDDSDIRYKVPIDGVNYLTYPEDRTVVGPEREGLVYPINEEGVIIPQIPDEHGPQVYPKDNSNVASPMINEKDDIDDSREYRGRTKTFNNQNY